MTTSKLILAQLVLVLGLVAAAGLADGLAGSPPYDLSWNTIDSGGGTSVSGSFELSGTIGQPDASVVTLAGGAYTLDGGFWPGAGTPIDDCPSDITNDDNVGVADLLAVIGGWGACATPCPPRCAADIAPAATGDCAVGVGDLLLVISTWGTCP